MKYIDLFGGIGGFSFGIEQATKGKFECVYYNDFDKYAVQTYSKNFGTDYEATDITTVKEADIPDHDLICGGFPCQTFSIAGKRRGFKDTRGTLFFEIMRIAKAKGTPYLFLENVKGLLNHEKGKTFRTILQTLSKLGYEVQWMVLNSKFFGVAQNRERVFIIGNLRSEPRPEILPFRKNAREISRIHNEQNKEPKMDTKDSTPDIPQANRRYGINGVSPPLNNWSSLIQTKCYKETAFDKGHRWFRESINSPCLSKQMGTGGNNVPMVFNPKMRDYKPKNVSPSLTSTDYKEPKVMITDNKLRRLTPIECERLQGFPDNWTLVPLPNGKIMSDTQRYKMMGNAVTVNVIKVIGEKLK